MGGAAFLSAAHLALPTSGDSFRAMSAPLRLLVPVLFATGCAALAHAAAVAPAAPASDEALRAMKLFQPAEGFTVELLAAEPMPGNPATIGLDHEGRVLRFGFTGDDLHGPVMGPDGRLYFSCGDRRANVKTQEGATLALPDEGAVLRCEPDGSHLEIFCSGLRHPRGLAFDKFGNLFTGDDGSGQGDRARWLYLVEGGDYGWRVGWQQHPLGWRHNPWLAEKLWRPHFEGRAACFLPPIASIPEGAAGLAYNPGTGLSQLYDGNFFLCSLSSSAAQSSISTWKARRFLAGFQLDDIGVFVGHCPATDIAFGPDSRLYFSECGEGGAATGRGRIFRVHDPIAIRDPQVEAVRLLLAEGFKNKVPVELSPLLGHKDQRIRLETQWEFATRPQGESEFADVAASAPKDALDPQLARLHGIWGLGSIARRAEYQTPGAAAKILAPLLKLLEDEDVEVRAQAARVLGENRVAEAFDGLMKTLRDPVGHVSFFAAQALAKLGRKECVTQVLLVARTNGEADPLLRHACVQALAAAGDFPALQEAAQHIDPQVRMAALLALRRLERPEIAQFLADENPLLVLEAARAIHDLPIDAARPQLAALLAKPTADEQLMLRVLNAAFRTGTAASAQALAEFAAKDGASDALRTEALQLLALWPQPPARDRVTGLGRPLPARDAAPAAAALHAALPQLLGASAEPVARAALSAIAALGMKAEAPALFALIGKKEVPAKVRGQALETLAALGDPQLPDALQLAAADPDATLAIAAHAMLAKADPAKAADQLAALFAKGTLPEKRAALTALGGIPHPIADHALTALLTDLRNGKIPAEAQVELLEAAAQHPAPKVQAALRAGTAKLSKSDPLAAFQPCLTGGDKDAGAALFFEHPAAACVRCHQLGEVGGDIGPDLTGIGARKDRAYLLESLVRPDARIAEGFQNILITLKTGGIHGGLLKSEDATLLTLQTPGTPPVRHKITDIQSRAPAPNAMPADLGQVLTKRQLRDLVEFLASLRN